MENIFIFFATPQGLLATLGGMLVVLAAAFAAFRGPGCASIRVRLMLCISLLYIAFVFFLLSFGLDEIAAVGSSARTVPRLWAAGLALFSGVALRRALKGKAPADPEKGDVRRVLAAAAIVAFSLWGMDIAGYFLSSAAMIILLCLLLEERRPGVYLSLTGGWLLFSWLVFSKLLTLGLPSGILFG
ncbi:hypothetical protein MASR2M79_19960 [Aminivibrio sp.]|nr:hypothetical protein [Synergistaceae bacterium]